MSSFWISEAIFGVHPEKISRPVQLSPSIHRDWLKRDTMRVFCGSTLFRGDSYTPSSVKKSWKKYGIIKLIWAFRDFVCSPDTRIPWSVPHPLTWSMQHVARRRHRKVRVFRSFLDLLAKVIGLFRRSCIPKLKKNDTGARICFS